VTKDSKEFLIDATTAQRRSKCFRTDDPASS
jgi:hypothetical protein